MSMPERIVVLGADAAGMSAAHQILRSARELGREVEVTAIEKTNDTSYSACGIPYWVAGDVDDVDNLVARSPERHRELGVGLRTGTTVTGLDLSSKSVTLRTPEGRGDSLNYDKLIIATGAAAIIPEWARDADGTVVEGIGVVKTLDDGHAWIGRLTTRFGEATETNGSVAVIGAGYIGLEIAEAARRRGFDVTLVTRTTVMSSLDPDMSARIQEGLEGAGISVVTGSTVSSISRHPDKGSVQSVTLMDGRVITANLVAVAMGVLPVSGFGAAAGLPVGRSGGFLAGPDGLIAPDVWGAGDCCEARHRITGQWAFVPLGTHANKQGRIVGANVLGADSVFGGLLGTAITRFVHGGQHLEISRTGLSTAEAENAGLDVRSMTTVGRTASGYMPEASGVAVKILAEHGTRRLLGAQIVGGPGAGKRIDTVAAALWGSMTVDDLASMDLAYAPPFATVWEIVQLAARRLADSL